jgi:hypothetical protein
MFRAMHTRTNVACCTYMHGIKPQSVPHPFPVPSSTDASNASPNPHAPKLNLPDFQLSQRVTDFIDRTIGRSPQRHAQNIASPANHVQWKPPCSELTVSVYKIRG